MTKGKGTQIGTDTKPIILGKKRRSPNVNSQAYKDNFNKDTTSDNSDEVDAAIDALENPEDAEDEAGMTPEEIEERRNRRGGSRAEGGSVMKRGRRMHVTGTESRGTILSPA